MDGNPLIWQLLLQLCLILLNAVFACAEIAVLSVGDMKLAKLAEEGDKRALRLMRLTNVPARFLATIQVAITLAGFLGSAFAADNFSERLVEWALSLGVPVSRGTLDTVSVVVITLLLSYVTLVLGELVPKRVAMRRAESMALKLSALLTVVSKLFAPIVSLLTASTNGVLRLMGIDPNADDEAVTEEEICMMVDAGGEKGAIEPSERDMIKSVFELNDISASDLLTHRTKVVCLYLEDSDADWRKTIVDGRHSFYPVCGDSADDVRGVLSSKEYFRLEDQSRENVMRAAVAPARFVPETIKADVLLREMQKTRRHFALALDEHGGLSGVVTLNDLLEALVGDFADDGPAEPPDVQKIGEGKWRMRGDAPLEEVEAATGLELPKDEFDTLGGLIFSALSEIPEDGVPFAVSVGGLHIEVAGLQNHCVSQAVVTKTEPEAEKQAV